MIAFLIVLIATQTNPETPELTLREQQLVKRVESALTADPALRDLHRGYMSLLQREKKLGVWEGAFAGLRASPVLDNLIERFEAALRDDPALRKAFDDFYAALHNNADLRDAAESFDRWRQENRREWENVDDSLRDMLARPDLARQLLGAAPEGAGPGLENFAPLTQWLDRNPEQATQLRNWLTQGGAQELLGNNWWRALGAGAPEQEGMQAFETLDDTLLRRSGQFWTWQRRQEAIAARPEERDWVRYWHGRVEQDPLLSRDYWEYLNLMSAHPEMQKASEQRWRTEYGPAPAFPPKGEPPRLTGVRPLSTGQSSERAPGFERAKPSGELDPRRQPERPTVRRPARPGSGPPPRHNWDDMNFDLE